MRVAVVFVDLGDAEGALGMLDRCCFATEKLFLER